MTTKWFGDPWPSEVERAPVCEKEADHVPTPEGAACTFCAVPIRLGDQGVTVPHVSATGVTTSVMHIDCLVGTLIHPAVTP